MSATNAPHENPARAPLWGRLETLWLLMAPLCGLLYTLCLPLAPNDLWYHVRAGEIIWQNRAIPTQNLMSRAVPLDAPYYYQSWMAELSLFGTLKIGGLSGLVILRALCVTGALGLASVAAFRQLLRLETPPSRLLAARLTAFGTVIGLAMASNNVDLRPQTFSMLFFGAWTLGALEFRASRATHAHANRRVWGAFLVVLTWVWANTHGAFIVGILGLCALCLGDLISDKPRFRSSLGLVLAASAAALFNPRGAALYGYVAGLSRDGISQKWVQEWKTPGFGDWHSLLFWLGVAGLPAFWALAIRKKTRYDLGQLFALTLFAAMAARDQRSILWFALFLVPVSTLTLATLVKKSPVFNASISPTSVPRAAQAMNAVLLMILLALPCALLPQFKADWPWPAEFRRRFAPTPALFPGDAALLLENTTPVAAAAHLAKNPPQGKLWSDMVCGSYLAYAGRGQILPLCDPRIELFPATFWEDYLHLSSGPPNAAQILQDRGFSDALLDRDSMPGLVKRLRDAPQWHIVAQNGSTVLFRLRTS